MIRELQEPAALYEFEKRFVYPWHFPASYEQWEKAMFRDTDGTGRTLFRDLTTLAAFEQGRMVGYIQYGKSAFGFDDSGEISDRVCYPIVRALWFEEGAQKDGAALLERALEAFPDAPRVYAFFHYFGMSCYARHGKLFEEFPWILQLLTAYGFRTEHENVYYASALTEGPQTDIRIQWGNLSPGAERSACFFQGGSFVGECEVHFVSPEIAYLRWIGVKRELRYQGVGTRCMHSLKSALQAEGFTRLDTDTALNNLPAQHFYEKNGFTREGISRSFYADHPGKAAAR